MCAIDAATGVWHDTLTGICVTGRIHLCALTNWCVWCHVTWLLSFIWDYTCLRVDKTLSQGNQTLLLAVRDHVSPLGVRSFSTKEPRNQLLFCGKWRAKYGDRSIWPRWAGSRGIVCTFLPYKTRYCLIQRLIAWSTYVPWRIQVWDTNNLRTNWLVFVAWIICTSQLPASEQMDGASSLRYTYMSWEYRSSYKYLHTQHILSHRGIHVSTHTHAWTHT